jgi:hypothetical protein
MRRLPHVTRPWRAVAVVLAGLALVALFNVVIVQGGICAFTPCDPLIYSPLGVTLADDRRTIRVAWPRCQCGGRTIRKVQLAQPQSQGGRAAQPLVLWQVQGSVDGTQPAFFDVGGVHPGMRTVVPLRTPLPTAQDLQAVLTTVSTDPADTVTQEVVFRAADLRPGVIHWGQQLNPDYSQPMDDQLGWWTRHAGAEAGACMGGFPGGKAWWAVAVFALLSAMALPMAIGEGRRWRRDHPPPPPVPPDMWGRPPPTAR